MTTPEQEKKMIDELRIRCANLEKAYRENYPATVKRAREEARADLLKEVYEWLQPSVTTEYGETMHPFEDNNGCPQWSEDWAEELKKKFGHE